MFSGKGQSTSINGWKSDSGIQNLLQGFNIQKTPKPVEEKALLLHLADNAVSGVSNRDGFVSEEELSALSSIIASADKNAPLYHARKSFWQQQITGLMAEAAKQPLASIDPKNTSSFKELNPSNNPTLEKTLKAISSIPEGKLLIEKAIKSKVGIFFVFDEQLRKGTGGSYYHGYKLIALPEGKGLNSENLFRAICHELGHALLGAKGVPSSIAQEVAVELLAEKIVLKHKLGLESDQEVDLMGILKSNISRFAVDNFEVYKNLVLSRGEPFKVLNDAGFDLQVNDRDFLNAAREVDLNPLRWDPDSPEQDPNESSYGRLLIGALKASLKAFT